jgi:type II secretory pathway pseudopilin PulG
MKVTYNNKKGYTLFEVLIAISIFIILTFGVAWVLIISLRTNSIVWDQLGGQNEARKVLEQVVDDVRRAEESSLGSYPFEIVSEYEIIFYANIDNDSFRERVHYWLDGTTFKKGVITPSGSPLVYDPIDEQVVEIAHDVVNVSSSVPIFLYYDELYTGTQDSISDPVGLTAVRVIRLQLEIEHDVEKSPVPLHVESVVSVRSLKGE